MPRMTEWIGRELKWVQPHALKMEYELRADEAVVATLRFRSSFGSYATAESAEGCWTFKRVGFWQTRVTIRACGAGADLAVFKNNTWTSGGTLELPGGRSYRASTNFWATRYDFESEAGQSVFQYRRIGGMLHLSAGVEIQPQAAAIAELPWMVMLGWYLVLMLQVTTPLAQASGFSVEATLALPAEGSVQACPPPGGLRLQGPCGEKQLHPMRNA